jgi:hypothetical protein
MAAFLYGADGVAEAATTKIEATFHQEGSRVFTFNAVRPLVQHSAFVAYRAAVAANTKRQQDEAEATRASAERDRQEREGPGRFTSSARVACAGSSNATDRLMQAGILLDQIQGDPCMARPLVSPLLTEECLRRIEADAPDTAAELRKYLRNPKCP